MNSGAKKSNVDGRSKYAHGPSGRQTKKNVAYLWLNKFIALLFPIVTTPIIVNGMSADLVAIWLYSAQLAVQFAILDFGITNSLTRIMASSSINAEEKRDIFFTGIYFLAVVAIILLLVTPFLAEIFISELEGLDPKYVYPGVVLLSISLSVTALTLIARPGYSLLAAKHKFDLFQKIDIVYVALKFLSILLIFKVFEPSLFKLGVSIYGVQLAATLFSLFLGMKIFGLSNEGLKLRSFSKRRFKNLMSISAAMMAITLGAVILNQGSTIAGAHLLGVEAIIPISLSLLIFVSITPFFQVFAAVIAPIAAGISSQKEIDYLKEDFYISSKYIMFSGLCCTIFFYMCGEAILGKWLMGKNIGSKEVSNINTMLTVMLGGYSLGVISSIGKSILSSVGKHWLSAGADVITAILGLLFGFILADLFQMGITGFAFGVGMGFVLRGCLVYPFFLAKYFNEKTHKILKRVSLSAILANCIALTLSYIIGLRLRESEVFALNGLDLSVIPFVCIQALFFWLFILDKDHKRRILSNVNLYLLKR